MNVLNFPPYGAEIDFRPFSTLLDEKAHAQNRYRLL